MLCVLCVLCASVLIFSTQRHKDTETLTTKSNVNIIYGRFLIYPKNHILWTPRIKTPNGKRLPERSGMNSSPHSPTICGK